MDRFGGLRRTARGVADGADREDLNDRADGTGHRVRHGSRRWTTVAGSVMAVPNSTGGNRAGPAGSVPLRAAVRRGR